jgi:cytochrome o ubiquinol oxidase subunit 3
MHEINHHEMHGKPHDADTRIIFGFWVYVMSDCVLFASIFATYAVLHGNTFGGPSARELFSLPFVLTETLLLLTSSFTYGMAMVAGHHSNKTKVLYWLLATFVLGGAFLTMEVTEFAKMIGEGSGPERSGFLSAFFTLVGTHGLHVTLGLVWAHVGHAPQTHDALPFLAFPRHYLDIYFYGRILNGSDIKIC